MTSFIQWEYASGRILAELRSHRDRPAISRSYADGLVKGLMHDVISIQASFGGGEEIVFERCAEISIFDSNRAEFYGFYRSTVGAKPAYCLRKLLWKRKFKDFDSILAGLSANTIFFDASTLDQGSEKIVADLDMEGIEDFSVMPLNSEAPNDLNSRFNYYFINNDKTSAGSYRRNSQKSEAVESLFFRLSEIYLSLETRADLPAADTFKLLYANDCYSRVFERRR